MESLPADLCCVQVRLTSPCVRLALTLSSQYGELFSIFHDLAKEAGVDLHFDTKVVSIDPWQGSVICEDGRQWNADIVVGADGTESIVRSVVVESSAPPPDCDNRFTVK